MGSDFHVVLFTAASVLKPGERLTSELGPLDEPQLQRLAKALPELKPRAKTIVELTDKASFYVAPRPIDEIAKQEQPVVQQQAQLTSRAGVLGTDLIGFQLQIATLQQLAAQQRNGGLQQQYLAQANALAITVGRLEADLLATNGLIPSIRSQRAGLRQPGSRPHRHPQLPLAAGPG